MVRFEMAVNARRAKSGCIAAVRLAKRLNITLCGFVRGEEITVYTKAERVG